MSRGVDKGSWALEQANSQEHLRVMSRMNLDNYWASKMKEIMSRKTQAASDGSAKPLFVGSTPTSCSKD